MRRLLPQALVVAFLAGGTTAFVAEDKAVELTVDGKPRTLHTFADDVGELLAEEGVKVGAHDVVGARPRRGPHQRRRGRRPLRTSRPAHPGRPPPRMWTTAHTVEEALRQLGVRAEGAYMSVSRSQPIGRAGLALDVRTERSVTVMADGRARTVRTNAATVREAVQAAGITLRGQDTTSVDPGSFPRDGQTVTVLRITGSQEVREEQIPFPVRRTEDPSLFKGTEVVERAGQPGLRRITYALRTVNGVRQRPRRIRDEVVRAPRAQVVKVGTKPRPTSVQRGRRPELAVARCLRVGGPAERGRLLGHLRRALPVRHPHLAAASAAADGPRTRRRRSRRSARRSCTCAAGRAPGRTAGRGVHG